MQSTSATWDSYFAAGEASKVRAIINGTTYGMDKIVACSISRDMLEDIGLGSATAAQLDLTLIDYSSIPKMASIQVDCCLTNGTTDSEWLPMGTFYLDTREELEGGKLLLHAYDAMLKGDVAFTYSGDTMTTTAAVSQICTALGVSLDSRVSITEYTINRGQPYTCREILRFIGASQGGSWVITPANKLTLVPLKNTAASVQDIGLGCKSLQLSGSITISGVELVYADGASYADGDDTTFSLAADCPWATQAMATALYTALDGVVYQPYQATGVFLNPAIELGDNMTIDDPAVTVQLASVAWRFSAATDADIASPHEQEVDHEYPYKSETERQFERLASYIKIGAVQDPEGSGNMVAGISILNSTNSLTKIVETGTGLYFLDSNDNVIMKIIQDNGIGIVQMGDFAFVPVGGALSFMYVGT